MQDLSTLVRETSSQPDASLRLCKLSNRVEALQEFIDNPVEWVPRDARDALEKKSNTKSGGLNLRLIDYYESFPFLSR